jgi:periplasmic protein TonB
LITTISCAGTIKTPGRWVFALGAAVFVQVSVVLFILEARLPSPVIESQAVVQIELITPTPTPIFAAPQVLAPQIPTRSNEVAVILRAKTKLIKPIKLVAAAEPKISLAITPPSVMPAAPESTTTLVQQSSSAPTAPISDASAGTPLPTLTRPQVPPQVPSSAVAYLFKFEPAYPPESLRLDESGSGMLKVLIDEEGLPRSAEIIQSSNYRRLDQTALGAAKKSRFRPYTANGRAQAVYVLLPFEFKLE